MLIIRLQRTGKRGQAYFRVVLLEHSKKPKGEFQELLGNYDPHQKKFSVKRDRVEYWMSKGAQITPTVNNLMVNHKVWDRPKMASWKPKKSEKQEVKSEKAETDGGQTPIVEAEASKEEVPPTGVPAETEPVAAPAA